MQNQKCALNFKRPFMTNLPDTTQANLIHLGAYAGFFGAIFTPENIAICSGVFSIVLSFSGILLNLIKIFKTNKTAIDGDKQNEKNS